MNNDRTFVLGIPIVLKSSLGELSIILALQSNGILVLVVDHKARPRFLVTMLLLSTGTERDVYSTILQSFYAMHAG